MAQTNGFSFHSVTRRCFVEKNIYILLAVWRLFRIFAAKFLKGKKY